MRKLAALVVPLLLLAACSAPAQPGAVSSPAPSGTATARATAPAAATAAPAESAAPAVAPDGIDYSQVAGRNADGTFYRGSADAPVTLVDHSDFL